MIARPQLTKNILSQHAWYEIGKAVASGRLLLCEL